MSKTLDTTDSVTATYSATVGGSESEELASNFNITAGASVTATASTTDTFTANPGQDIECFYGQSYTETQGTADQYSADGYDGNSP